MSTADNSSPNKPKKRGNPNMQKGVQPPWLKGHGFDGHPEHINRYGVPSDVVALKRLIQAMGNEAIVVETAGKGKTKNKVLMTRFERIVLDWFNSQSFEKQQAIMQYGIGKVPDKIEISGQLKVIKVSLKKKLEENNDANS